MKIEEIKEKFNTDLADFELVEVEEWSLISQNQEDIQLEKL